MKASDLINLIRRHLILLLITPIIMAGIVAFFTRMPSYRYSSETTLYTGMATGSSVELDKLFNYQTSSTSFDNLISIIQSRETQQEVAIRLLAQHLSLKTYQPHYLSQKSYDELNKITPLYIRKLVATAGNKEIPTAGQIPTQTNVTAVPKDTIEATKNDSSHTENSFSFSKLGYEDSSLKEMSDSTDQALYEKTVTNLTDYMLANDTNFVYKLLNYAHPHYSINAISSVSSQRIANSDLVQLNYESDDPVICQQTLRIFTEVCIKNYKSLKANRSNDVVKYFEFQLKQANNQLNTAEDKLLNFNIDNNIINYNEQSKAIALKKEQLEVEYNTARIKLAGVEATILRLEEKLGTQHQIQLNTASIIEKRNQLVDLNYKIESAETTGTYNDKDQKLLVKQKAKAERLKEDISLAVNQLYNIKNSKDGLPVSKLLDDWITNVLEAESLKAQTKVLSLRMKEFQKEYDLYVPAGSNVKKIEREISVAEQQYLEILRSLNLAKLKMNDDELASIIKIVDAPYYPLNPIPTKRKILVLFAAFLGFMIVLSLILILEYFDNSLHNTVKVFRKLNLPFLGIFPKIIPTTRKNNLLGIANQLLGNSIQNIALSLLENPSENITKTLLFFSIAEGEGKSVLIGNLANKLKQQGKKVLVLNYSTDTNDDSRTNENYASAHEEKKWPSNWIFSSILRLLGYPATAIDYGSPFLAEQNQLLSKNELFYYAVKPELIHSQNYQDLLGNSTKDLTYVPDYVLIELPAVSYHTIPVGLIRNSDIAVLICRANRNWTTSDQGMLNRIVKLSGPKIQLILNGVELRTIHTVMDESVQ